MFTTRPKYSALVFLLLSLVALNSGSSLSQNSDRKLNLTADLFRCLTDMTRAEGEDFYVDNLLGNLGATLAAANSPSGGTFPPGSVVSLIPSEIMVKHREGWNPETNDWEFIELDFSSSEAEFSARGTTEVENRYGNNCYGCHQLAGPEWDLICGKKHGCAPLSVPRELILGMQVNDPRCIRED